MQIILFSKSLAQYRHGSKSVKNHSGILDGISKVDIIDDLRLRKVKFSMDEPQKNLLERLRKEIAGTHRMPAPLFEDPEMTLGTFSAIT